ncbi:MAG: glycosyltransferase family A protein [Rhizomicrobium sp.]
MLRILRRDLGRAWRGVVALAIGYMAMTVLAWEWAFRRYRRRESHGLPAPLLVSLTSYRARFPTLAFTLRSLLLQRMAPDRIILWIADADISLPAAVLRLAERGVEIRRTADLGPYTKLIPAIAAQPGWFVVTADDDTYYPSDWLAGLVAAFDAEHPAVICHRAHRVGFTPSGLIQPYAQWEKDVAGPQEGIDLLPTGVGGVLYAPAVAKDMSATIMDIYALAPKADDLGLFWASRLIGLRTRKTSWRRSFASWPGSQRVGLFRRNNRGDARNDFYLARLIDVFGLPSSLAGRGTRS